MDPLNACSLPMSVNEVDFYKAIKIYPNPVSNQLILENFQNIEIESITLSNINGHIIKQYEARENQLDISDLCSGIYLLKISSKDGVLIEKILIE